MSTDTATNPASKTVRVRELNDALHMCTDPIGALMMNGQLVITRGIAAQGNAFIAKAVTAVRSFNDFTQENDPFGEHDFAFLDVDGEHIFFKVDYYDCDLKGLSPDASDPAVTPRVLTIALAEEY